LKCAVVARSGLFIMLSCIKIVKPGPEPTTSPPIFNVDNIVALLVVKLNEVISYMPELFII
jgi:hypothetical protein